MLESGRPSMMEMGFRRFAGASDESRAIRFILQIADGIAFDDKNMGGPDGRFVVGSFAARGEDRSHVGNKFRLDEEI